MVPVKRQEGLKREYPEGTEGTPRKLLAGPPALVYLVSSSRHTRKHQKQMLNQRMSLSLLAGASRHRFLPQPPAQVKERLTGDIEVRGVEILPWW